MEAVILIPIAVIIFGWKAIHSMSAPVEIENGTGSAITFGNGFSDDYVINEDTPFAWDDESYMSFDGMGTCSGDDIFNDDSNNFSSPFFADDLMFNPAYDWCSFNIYHHSDTFNDMDVTNSFNDSFSSEFSDISSPTHSFTD